MSENYNAIIQEAITALQNAQETVVQARAEILNAPKLAAEALASASASDVRAGAAQSAAEVANAKADAQKAKLDDLDAALDELDAKLDADLAAEAQARDEAIAAASQQAAQDLAAKAGELAQAISAADAKSGQAQATASAALPKSGGELTGALFQKSLSSLDNNAAEANYITKDINDNIRSIYRSTFDNTGLSTTSCEARSIKEDNTTAATAVIRAYALRDGTTYAIAPPPRTNNYGNDIVTMKTMRDNTLYYLPHNAYVYIDPLTGSDTADLFAGRGLSVDKAFKSFDGAMNWLERCAGDNIGLKICNDVTWNGIIENVNIENIHITSLTEPHKTITVTTRSSLLRSGHILLQNIKLKSEGNTHIIRAEGGWGAPVIYMSNNVVFEGSVTDAVAIASQNAVIQFGYKPGGNVTGRRYHAVGGSKILVSGGGADYIPGTESGVMDASSYYG